MSAEGVGAGGLCVLITPSAASAAWRDALSLHAARIGWSVSDAGVDPAAPPASGLVFAHDHAAMLAFPPSARAVIVDTTATDTDDPALPAAPDVITIRSHILVEAEAAAAHGAVVLNAARYLLDFPVLGSVERREGAPYRIHPSVAESPLAIFDDTRPGSWANWHPRWFSYPKGHAGTIDAPLIDLTGRMRPLIYGPYIRLPAGRWRVDLRFTVDPERAHAPLLFEWGAGADYCRIMTEIRYPGTYTISLDRIWPEADAAQLRIWTSHPVFQGTFGFQGCRVTRVAADDPAPLTPTDRIVDAEVV
ncbi:MAG: hypothetical protein KKA16_08440 [Alphaproteobacteria bacterium]|nr:hypothetical protein [Alphaproteobacteria bacterium]MBU2378919.1 hypothetical protein [Alphaproteobacteria bacterium]